MAGKDNYIHAVGKRKNAVARVHLKEGSGSITVNQKPYIEYFGRATLQMLIRQPLELIDQLEKFDITINANGGGPSGQAGAVRHGIARALEKFDGDNRPSLKKAGFLTRDAREVERKKYGRHKARKSTQFSKR